MSSVAHSFGSINLEDINSEKSYDKNKAYSQSKLANILFTRSLAKQLKGVYYICIASILLNFKASGFLYLVQTFYSIILIEMPSKAASVFSFFDCFIHAALVFLLRHRCDGILSPSWRRSDRFMASSKRPSTVLVEAGDSLHQKLRSGSSDNNILCSGTITGERERWILQVYF